VKRTIFLIVLFFVVLFSLEVATASDSLNVSIQKISDETGMWCGIVNDTLALGAFQGDRWNVKLFDVSRPGNVRFLSSFPTVSNVHSVTAAALLKNGRIAINRSYLQVSGDMTYYYVNMYWWADYFSVNGRVVLQDSARDGWTSPREEPMDWWQPGQICVDNGMRAYIPGYLGNQRTMRILDGASDEWQHPRSVWGSEAVAIAAKNGLVAVSVEGGGLALYWDSVNRAPALQDWKEQAATASKLVIKDSLLFACYDDSINIINVRIPSQPQNISTFRLPEADQGGCQDAVILGDLMLMTGPKASDEGEGWLLVYNVSDLQSPRLVGHYRGVAFSNLGLNGNGSVLARANDGVYLLHLAADLEVAEVGLTLPANFTLSAYPNPFNAVVTIGFASLPASGGFLRIYDQSGRNWSRTMLDGQTGKWVWDAAGAPAGSYFIELQSSGGTVVKPVTLLK